MNLFTRTLNLARSVLRETEGKAALALAFLLLGSLTESISILLLIPLLQLIGPGAGAVDSLHVPVVGQLRDLGIRFELVPLLIFFVALTTVQALFSRFRALYMTATMQVAIDKVRMDLFTAIGKARWSLIASTRTADLNHALTTDIDRAQVAIYSLLTLTQNILLLIIYAGLAALVSIKMTAFAMVVGGGVLIALFPLRRRASRRGHSLSGALQDRQRTVSEFLSGMKIAKAFNSEPGYFSQLSGLLAKVRADMLHFSRMTGTSTFIFQISSTIAAAIFVYIAFVRFHLPMPRIAVMLFLFMRVSPRFNSIQDSIQQLITNLPAFVSVNALIRRFEAAQESKWDSEMAVLSPLSHHIRFDDVTFRYSDDPASQVLHDARFVIPAGSVTAIIGPSGSGKSTIADLVLGLLEPSEGRITIDGATLDAGNRRSWRDQIAYVPQDVFLLHASIRDNLAMSGSDIDDAAIWAALEAASAKDFISRLPEGLDTIVGDRGIRLSGGERQRIALARGLLRRPRLLILDEATSALDWENQQLIAKSIEALRGTMTVITIAHRPSMIAFADWVVTVEDGRVIETGGYADLIARPDSRLRRLVAGEQVLD